MPFRHPTTRFQRIVEFTPAEVSFLESIKPWSKEQWKNAFGTPEQNRNRDAIKAKLKDDLDNIQNSYCAFCGLSLALAYEVHREHIAPQYKHPHYIFEPKNIVLCCNFCNMHKGKKLTVSNDTNVYDTTTFTILHPYRDDFNVYLACDYANREIIFTIVGPDAMKAQKTIDCIGLSEPHLMSQRGAIIFKNALPRTPDEDTIIKEILSKNRHRT